ncbi:MAG TPA: hypothetical protein VGK38_13265, partial [Prolixibacteraceae bacterium]
MGRFFLLGIIFGLTSLISNGQTNDELRNLWQNKNFSYFGDNQKERLFSRADFYKYAVSRDEEYADYLKDAWSDFSILPGIQDEQRHPKEQPVFVESELDMNPPVNLPFSNIIGFSNSGNSQVRMIPRIRRPESETFNAVYGVVSFYGQSLRISYDKLLAVSKISSLSQDSISVFWTSFARSNSNHLVDQLMVYRDLLGLGDWGYFQLVKATSNQIFTNNALNSDLLTWALMIRSGFDVRFAFNQS